MEFTRVAINTASVDEISALYDIGPRRAQYIVEHRQTNGSFRSPLDLAQVKDIAPKLALTLSPHIDWRLPEEPEPPKEQDRFAAALWISILVCLLAALLLLSIIALSYFGQSTAIEPIRIVAVTAGFTTLLCFGTFVALRAGVALTRRRERARKLAASAIAAMAVALYLGIPILVGSGIYLSYVAGQPASSSVRSWPLEIVNALALLLLYLLMTPQIIVWWRPQWADSRWLAGTFDFTFALAGVSIVWVLGANVQTWPLWLLALAGMSGLLIVIVSVLSIRRGETFFRTSLDFLDSRRDAQRDATMDHWRYWASINLPDPAQQRMLQAALNDMHRVGRERTVLKALIFGAGWWLIITALEAIFQQCVLILWSWLFK